MTDTSKQSLAILRQIAEFIEGLPPDQVDDLAEGRARLTMIPWGSSEPLIPAHKTSRKAAAPAQSTVDVDAIVGQIEAATSREITQAILAPLKVPDLKAVAAALQISAPAGTKAPLIKQIVELTIGARLSGDALRAL